MAPAVDYLPSTIGLPSDVHFSQPLATDDHTSVSPACLSSSAARALVCSASQLQYVATGLPRARSSAVRSVSVLDGIHVARGTCPAKNAPSLRTSTTTIEFSARRFLNVSNAIRKSGFAIASSLSVAGEDEEADVCRRGKG
jgi:hypothetical protein